jgi:hypothetical protein
MKNKFLALLVLLGLFGLTATGAQAHAVHHFNHGFHHHHFYHGGQWYDYDDDCVYGPAYDPGFVIHINL